ncbi:hypothetical protein TNCV_1773051 [Trichonephila clavipes]|nr:hypothetical protein TNCV_1773051 [Trichonephila clavipes]
MDVGKCTAPPRHEGTLNGRQAASFFGRLVDGEKRLETPVQPQCVLLQNWGGIEPNCTVISLVSKLRITTGIYRPFAVMNFLGP